MNRLRLALFALLLSAGSAFAQTTPWSTFMNGATDIGTLTDGAKFGLTVGAASARTATGLEIQTYLTAKNNTWSGTNAFNSTVSGTGITSLFASPPPIGGTAAAAGTFTTLSAGATTLTGSLTGAGATFTTLSASGAVSGAGITSLFASPPVIGGTVAAAASFTTLGATGNLTTNITGSTQCVQANSSGVLLGTGSPCGSGGGGGSLAVTDGTRTVTGTTTLNFGNGFIVTGSAGNATTNLTFIDKTVTANYSAAAGDMGNGTLLSGSGATLTLPAVSATLFAPGMTYTVANNGAGNWTLVNSTGLTLTGLNSTTLPPGFQGTFVANNNATGLDFFPAMQYPSSSVLGGVLSSTAASHQFATAITTAGALTYAQPASTDISGLGTFATANAATPPAIGGTTPAAGSFTTLSATGNITTAVTGSIQCLQVNSSGVISGAGAGCNTGGTGTLTNLAPAAGIATTRTGGQGAITTTGSLYADASYFPFLMGGLVISNDGVTPNTVIDTATGVAVDDANSVFMKIAAFTKTTGAWTLGTGNGCLDTGSVATSTWYHLFIIMRSDTGVVDELCTTSAASPTMPTNYDKKRRIGSFKTNGSAQIIAFTQVGTIFYWATQTLDINTSTLGTAAALQALNVPPGVKVQPLCRYSVGGAGNAVILTSGDETDVAPTATTPFSAAPGFDQLDNTLTVGDQNTVCPYLTTNASSQVRARATAASTTLAIVTRGWID